VTFPQACHDGLPPEGRAVSRALLRTSPSPFQDAPRPDTPGPVDLADWTRRGDRPRHPLPDRRPPGPAGPRELREGAGLPFPQRGDRDRRRATPISRSPFRFVAAVFAPERWLAFLPRLVLILHFGRDWLGSIPRSSRQHPQQGER